MESVGTKAYTKRELRALLEGFESVELETIVTPYDRERVPLPIGRMIPSRFGWFVAIDARKPGG